MTTITKILAVEANAQIALVSDLTISCVASLVFQGGPRQLARDRWNWMYPS